MYIKFRNQYNEKRKNRCYMRYFREFVQDHFRNKGTEGYEAGKSIPAWFPHTRKQFIQPWRRDWEAK